MAYTITPVQTIVINSTRREITTSVEIDDGEGDVRIVAATGKAKTTEEKLALRDALLRKYHREIAWEETVGPIIIAFEAELKLSMEAQLNG